ncbi:uncharacterized protein C9orf131 homolog [Dromiciops gliroides]|uniref:uncharacterized protein C9orf131 homolog n=1 Tax=Dromiciops gliroides TaxID=33562 RepID=UPI001CC49920|nr:uncharacterized protein C9orf131 homolog [Dromiciops gliroides]
MGLLGKMEWVRMLTAKAQLGLIWEEIKEALRPLGCPQCGCSCLQSPGNLLILLLFLIWQFRRKHHPWLPNKQDGSQSMVLSLLFPTSHKFPERAQSWQPQSWKGALFYKEEEEEEEQQQKDEEEKEEDLLRQKRLEPWWYSHPRNMEAEQKTSFFQTETLGTPNEQVGNLRPSFWGPHEACQPFRGSKRLPVKRVTLEPMPNSNHLHSPTGLNQAPTSLCPHSTSSEKAKGSIQFFWGLPSLHSESLEATFLKSVCTFPDGATNQQLPLYTPLIFFNDLSYHPLSNLKVKTVSLPPPYLPSISPLPALHENCETAEMASFGLPNGPEAPWWASESQGPIPDPLLPLRSPPYSPVKPQEVHFMGVTKVMASDDYEVPGPQNVQQSKLPWPPKSLAQTPSSSSVAVPKPQGITGPIEDLKVVVSEALLGNQQQIQFPQDLNPSGPHLNTSLPHLLKPQEADLRGAWSEIAPMTEPKASCYKIQQSELLQAAGTPTSWVNLQIPPEPQGTGLTRSPRVTSLMTPHGPEIPWYNMQEKEPPWAAGPPGPEVQMKPQTGLQGASPIEVSEGTVPSWDITQTQPPWIPVLSLFHQVEPQGANSEGTPIHIARLELPGWGVQQIHLSCTLRHNTPLLEPPSHTWMPPLRVPAKTQEDKHYPPGSLTEDKLPTAGIMTSMPQEEAPLHTQGTLGPGTEGCLQNKEPRIQFKKNQYNPGYHSLAPSPPASGLSFPRTPLQQGLCPLDISFCPLTCQNPALNPTSQRAVGTLSSNCVHVHAKKAMSQDAKPLHCHPPSDPQLWLQELARDEQSPARKGRDVSLMPPKTPDLQSTEVPESQSLSQYNKNMTASKMPCMHRKAKLGGSKKSEPLASGKSQAKASVLSRKREHSRKPKAEDQGGGDGGWGVSPSKGKNPSSEGKKLTSHSPAQRCLASPPHQGSGNLCQTASRLELPQPSTMETSQVHSSQGPSKGQGAGWGDNSDSQHWQDCSQGDWGLQREAGKGSNSNSSGPAKRGLQKFLGGLLNNPSPSQRAQSVECLQEAIKVTQDPMELQHRHLVADSQTAAHLVDLRFAGVQDEDNEGLLKLGEGGD